MIYIDVGSFTVKIYKHQGNNLIHHKDQTINFKKGFNIHSGISKYNREQLTNLILNIKKEFPNDKIKIYSTAIFRKMHEELKVKFIDDFYQQTGLLFNIISHELENHYLETALIANCSLNEPILLVNIGGGSTELVVVKEKQVLERKNINIGVGIINEEFPAINDDFSPIDGNDIVRYVQQFLQEIKYKPTIAFYNGHELNYMKLTKYPLIHNIIFNDPNHPFMINIDEFKKHNKLILNKVSLKHLEKLMPDNPIWMHGARGCSFIAQAVFDKYKIQSIVPSDSDLVHGIVKQEFRTVTLSGSFRKHLDYLLKIKKLLESKNIKVLSPRFENPNNPGDTFVVFNGEEGLSPLELERHHLNSINNSDALIVCNPGGYVGASSLIEIGFAHRQAKRIIFTEDPAEFMLKTLPAEIGL